MSCKSAWSGTRKIKEVYKKVYNLVKSEAQQNYTDTIWKVNELLKKVRVRESCVTPFTYMKSKVSSSGVLIMLIAIHKLILIGQQGRFDNEFE